MVGTPAIGAGEGLGVNVEEGEVEVAATCSVGLDVGTEVKVAVGLAVELGDGVKVGLGNGVKVELAVGLTDGIMTSLAKVAEGWINVWVGRTGTSVKVGGAAVYVEVEIGFAGISLPFVKYHPPIPIKRRSKTINTHVLFFCGCLAMRAVAATGKSGRGSCMVSPFLPFGTGARCCVISSMDILLCLIVGTPTGSGGNDILGDEPVDLRASDNADINFAPD